jgi:hypothetical protein
MARFDKLSPQGQQLAVVGLAASLAVVAAAERDLHHRPAAEVRGSKLVWRLVCLNALGALAYFKAGRLPPAA